MITPRDAGDTSFWQVTAVAVVVVAIALALVLLLSERARKSEDCRARGGVWLAHDDVCVKELVP